MTAYLYADGNAAEKGKIGNVERGVNYQSNFLDQVEGLGSNTKWTKENSCRYIFKVICIVV